MKEIESLARVDEALSGLDDAEAVARVLAWAMNKFGRRTGLKVPQSFSQGAIEKRAGKESIEELREDEIPGVALLTEGGEFRLTVRDPKAKNTNDAAIRLALVSILAYCQLSGQKSASSKQIVKPVLEDWRAYTGNTRQALARHPGIIRNGDALSLDQHARAEAEEFVDEILDDEIKGSWQPTGRKSRSSSSTKMIGSSRPNGVVES